MLTEIFVNITNDVKEIVIYGIEFIICILKIGKGILENIDIDELIIGK